MENLDNMDSSTGLPYQYAVVGRALNGDQYSGDAALVQATADGMLVAVVDGLGHGAEAAVAASAAIGVFREFADQPLPVMLQRCHESLQSTRGVAVALASFHATQSTMTWAGVGNVEAILIAATPKAPRAKLCLTNQSGVVGYRLPSVRTHIAPISHGDMLILATDGIDERFISEDMPYGDADSTARTILERYGKRTDDALVLVLRWLGDHVSGLPGR